jgi:hypothetical protein
MTPISEGQNYGREMAGRFGLRFRLPRKSQGSLTCHKFATWDRWLYFPSEGRHAVDFFTRKVWRLRPGSNPRSCVPEASMLTTRPPKLLAQKLSSFVNFFSMFWMQVKCFNLLRSLHDLIFREFLKETAAFWDIVLCGIVICFRGKGTLKAQNGGRVIALLFLDLSARNGVGGQHHAPVALLPGKTWYPLYRRLGGPQGREPAVLRDGGQLSTSHSGHFTSGGPKYPWHRTFGGPQGQSGQFCSRKCLLPTRTKKPRPTNQPVPSCQTDIAIPTTLVKTYQHIATSQKTVIRHDYLYYSEISIYHFSREWRKQTMNVGKRLIRKTNFLTKKVIHCLLLLGRILPQLKIWLFET